MNLKTNNQLAAMEGYIDSWQESDRIPERRHRSIKGQEVKEWVVVKWKVSCILVLCIFFLLN